MSDPGNHISTGMSDSGSKHISTSKTSRRKLILLLFTSFLLIDAVIGTVAGVNSRKNTIKSSSTDPVIESSCSITPYPDLCYSTIADDPGEEARGLFPTSYLTRLVKGGKEKAQKLEKLAEKFKMSEDFVSDCIDMIKKTIHDFEEELEFKIPNVKKSTKVILDRNAADIKTKLSASVTNPVTCLELMRSPDAPEKKVQQLLNEAQLMFKECSNALAMGNDVTDTDIANEAAVEGRNLREEEGGSDWPKWLSAGDRRLLQSTGVTPDVVVAADGSGNYKTVSEAVAAAPESSSEIYVIRIKAGKYRENVHVPMKKTNLMFLGDGRTSTIITGSRNVVDGSNTFHSATVAVAGDGFLARDITFENTAGPSKRQAVALRVGSDHSAFYRCGIIGYRATLYVHSYRQFYINCYIAGTVDIIFGNAAAVLQDCDIHARRPNAGQINTITAQGRTDKNQNTGIIIQKCRIDATKDLKPVKSSFQTFLGRPWEKHSRTVIMQSTIGDLIDPAGWHPRNGDFALGTLEYREHANSGAGAGTSGRVKWGGYKVITNATEAQQYTPRRFIDGGSWLRNTTFPFSLGV